MLEATPGRPSVRRARPRHAAAGGTLLLCGHLDTVDVEGMADPHAPRVDGDRLYGRGAYDMKAGVAAALIACREAAALGLAGDVVVAAVADEEHASLGVQEVLRARARRRRDRHRADRARGRRRAQGLRLGGDRGHRPRRARLAPAPRRRRDRQGRAGPDRARRARRARSAARTHPLLGPRLGPRVGDRGRRGAVELPGALRASGSSAARCRARPPRTSRPSSTRCSTRCRAADPALVAEQRTLLVREPFEVDRGRGDRRRRARRGRGGARRAAADRRRELLGRRRVHRRRRHPDGHVRPGRRGRARRRGVGEPRRHRGRRAHARRRRRAASAREGAGQRRRATRRPSPPPSDEARRVPRGAARLRADAAARAAGVAAELGLGAVALKDESDRLGLPAFKVLGASWAVERALRERPGRRARSSRRAPATTAAPSRTSRRCAACAAASSCPPRSAAGAPRGDRGRGRRGRGRRRRLRGRGRARRRRRRARAGALEIADVGESGPGALGHRRLRDAVRRGRRAGARSTSLVVPGRRRLARGRRGALRRARPARGRSASSRRPRPA